MACTQLVMGIFGKVLSVARYLQCTGRCCSCRWWCLATLRDLRRSYDDCLATSPDNWSPSLKAQMHADISLLHAMNS